MNALRLALCGFMLVVGGAVRAQSDATPTFTDVSVHDPSVLRAGSTFYVFGSHLASASSSDLLHWTQLSTSAAAGNLLVPNPAVTFSEVLTWAQAATFWAPDAIRLGDGRYYLYYCACKGDSPRSALGLAVADSPTGPYTHAAVLLKSGMWGEVSPDGTIYDATKHPNVVDPSVFFDTAGKLWMVYGSYSGGIFLLQLDPATGLLLPGQGYGKKLIGGNHARIEAPCILYSPEAEYYHLFLSYGGLDSVGGYNIRVGRSRRPDGPYLDAAGKDLTSVAGAPGTLFDDVSIAPHGVKLLGGYQFLHAAGEASSTSRGYLSPGHNSAYRDPVTGEYFLVFHTRFVGRGEQHEVRVHPLFLNDAGWFVAAPHRYAGESMQPTDAGQVPGDYKLVNHGKSIAAGAVSSVAVALRADRTVTGAVAGNWALSGDHDATFTLGGTEYRGVFVRQWDDDNQMWVQAFSALSAEGVAVWGTKVAIAAAPAITAQPQSQSALPGQTVVLTVETGGTPAPTYQWRKDGAVIAGAVNSALTLSPFATSDAGRYTVVVTNRAGSATSAEAVLTVAPRPPQVVVADGDRSAQIVNLSTRGIVTNGEDVLIAGFVIAGRVEKKLLILASGLNLARLGVSGEIGRPHLTLLQNVDGTQVKIAENSDWQRNRAEVTAYTTQLGAQHFADSVDPAHGDAGIVVTLRPGVYTVVVAPDAQSANQDGVGLIEIYDASPAGGSRLVNISARGRIESGGRQMFVGAVLSGTGQQRLLLRGIGPGLQQLGITRYLPNPSQTLYRHDNGTQAVVATNGDWWNSAQADQVAGLAPKLGAFALAPQSPDSAILRLVEPGVYSAIIAPSDGTAGVALAEIYDANEP